jgi:hypothetical protein
MERAGERTARELKTMSLVELSEWQRSSRGSRARRRILLSGDGHEGASKARFAQFGATFYPAAAIHNLHRVGEGEGEGCDFGGLANRPTAMARATYCAMQL